MAENKLTVSGGAGGLAQAINHGGLGEIIKPLVNEIHLFDTFIAGTTHIKDTSVFEKINIGDRLTLLREESKFDTNAIVVLNEDKNKLGYIPEQDNQIFARLMDAGKMLAAKIKKIDKKGSLMQITIEIYLVDF